MGSPVVTLPLPVGQSSTNAALAPLVGMEIDVPSTALGTVVGAVGGVTTLKLVKSSAPITAANAFCVLWDAAESNTVGAITGAAADRATVAGVAILPSANVATATFFWVARRGPVLATSVGTITAKTALATHGAAGGLDDATVTDATRIAFSTAAIGAATTGVVIMVLP